MLKAKLILKIDFFIKFALFEEQFPKSSEWFLGSFWNLRNERRNNNFYKIKTLGSSMEILHRF